MPASSDRDVDGAWSPARAAGRARNVNALLAVCGGAFALAAIPLPWLSAGLGSDASSYGGFDLALASIPAALLSLTAIGCAIGWYFERDDLAIYAGIAAGALLLLTGLLLIAIEMTGALAPSSLLPATVRRSSSVLSAGPGLWSMAAGAIVVLIATSTLRFSTLDLRSWATPRNRGKLAASLLLLSMAILLGWLRYRPWIQGSALGQALGLTGRAAPWLGPTSLIAICLLAGALVLAVFGRVEAAGLVAAGAGWLISFLAAVAIIASESLGQLRLDLLLGDSPAAEGVGFHAASAAWFSFFGGVAVAALGGYLVASPSRAGEE